MPWIDLCLACLFPSLPLGLEPWEKRRAIGLGPWPGSHETENNTMHTCLQGRQGGGWEEQAYVASKTYVSFSPISGRKEGWRRQWKDSGSGSNKWLYMLF